MLRGVTFDDPARLGDVRSRWDGLAVHTSTPYCAPAWMLAWWKHVAPPAARLRVRAVFDGDELVGLAPFFVDRGVGGVVRYRLLGAGTSAPLDILARRGMEDAVASDTARFLADSDPAPDAIMFEGVRGPSPWPERIRERWAGADPPAISRQFTQPAPFVELRGATKRDWLTGLTSASRRKIRRGREDVERCGAEVRLSVNGEAFPRELDAFARLHYARWRARGGSGALDARVERMLLDAGAELLEQGRFRLWSIRIEERVISSHLFLSAGGETAYWLGGFDEQEHRIRRPGIIALSYALEHAFDAGDERLDLGGGAQRYKHELSAAERSLEWVLLVPRGWRAGLASAQLVRQRARHVLAQRLSPGTKRMIRRALAAAVRLRGS